MACTTYAVELNGCKDLSAAACTISGSVLLKIPARPATLLQVGLCDLSVILVARFQFDLLFMFRICLERQKTKGVCVCGARNCSASLCNAFLIAATLLGLGEK